MTKTGLKKILSSQKAKKFYLTVSLFFILFILCNDILLPWYVNRGGICVVPSVTGMKSDDARHLLDSLGFEPRIADTRMDRDHPAGIVIIQNPPSGDKVKRGRRVYLTVSGGEILISVPNIKGRTLRDALFVLEKEGLKLGAVEYAPSEEFPENTVVEQKINPGVKVKHDVYVSVVVSQGSASQKVAVPDITGKNLTEATTVLLNIGLKIGNVTYVPSIDLLPNTIVDQYPRVGEMVSIGQAVDLFVVQGAEKKKEILEN
jgi:eukaryotic-like serine/threonine-protein kinase